MEAIMNLVSLLRSWGFLRGHRPDRRVNFRPQLLALEDRALPSTFTVLNLNDSGFGSLRRAVLLANLNPGPDTINFKTGLTGTINLTSSSLTIIDDLNMQGPGADQVKI